jgi:Uma2 family endonuclease
VKTVVLGEPPPEITAFLARRRALGQDRFDEVWEGDYHVVPGPHPWHGYVDKALGSLLDPLAVTAGLVATGQFNLGEKDDFRVPDGGYHRTLPSDMFVPTAAIVVEIVSPGDETWEKFDFYARRGVDEIVVADPRAREVRWFRLAGTAYEETGASALLGVTAADLVARIDWP